MSLEQQRIILTGASGGIGRHIAQNLLKQNVKLGLVDIRQEALDSVVQSLKLGDSQVMRICADITNPTDQQRIVNEMQTTFGGVDMLINNAGLIDFKEFADEDPEIMNRILKVNVLAPMQLTRAVLPAMLQQNKGHTVNVGSIFGTLAFAFFTSYSTSKFALRGFSEALRRELKGTGVDVSYIAPRAVRTPLNTDAVMMMAMKTGMNMDDPALTARKIVQAINKRKKEAYLGFPESFFARLNSVFPRLIDAALHKQNQVMRPFTHAGGKG